MEQPERNEHVRPELTAGEALCAAIAAHSGSVFLKASPLGAILPLVVAHVRATDRRLALLERPAPGQSDLQTKLGRVIAVAEDLGQIPRQICQCDRCQDE